MFHSNICNLGGRIIRRRKHRAVGLFYIRQLTLPGLNKKDCYNSKSHSSKMPTKNRIKNFPLWHRKPKKHHSYTRLCYQGERCFSLDFFVLCLFGDSVCAGSWHGCCSCREPDCYSLMLYQAEQKGGVINRTVRRRQHHACAWFSEWRWFQTGWPIGDT